LSYGREGYRNNRYRWNGQYITNKVPKKWKTRRSRCQSEGRCPYVYAGKSDTKLGEILTNFVGTKRWRDQSILVPRALVEKQSLSILVSEEKLGEVTHIDSVWLMVDDTKLLPRSCPRCVPVAISSTSRSSTKRGHLFTIHRSRCKTPTSNLKRAPPLPVVSSASPVICQPDKGIDFPEPTIRSW